MKKIQNNKNHIDNNIGRSARTDKGTGNREKNQEEKRTLYSIKNKLRIISPWHKNEEELATAILQKGYSIVQELDLGLNAPKHLK